MESAMLDESLPATLRKATERVYIKDADGGIVGYFMPVRIAAPGVARSLSPSTREELEERRKDKEGSMPLAEVWRKMGVQ